ncbi:hypothetical protein [Fuscibacter oryzae]|uniref:Uncharacterized protein n=1 Tax=Fuscibacter oryzae TaxID=2803939 RepID=A0A8J7SUD9_9RHOB|nr:hypothetical protein [Fuscibacter oryzae]MBL4929510.1 hypothetical protein [Fuscibacter oryzae]
MKINTQDRDQVLYSFHVACPEPTAAEIFEWVGRFPAYADDIRAHAAIARDWAALNDADDLAADVDDQALARARSLALNIIYSTTDEAERDDEPAVGFWVRMQNRGIKVSAIAARMDIARAPIGDLFNGWIVPPIGRRFSCAIMGALGLDQVMFDREVNYSLAHPRLGEAKASGPPQILQLSYRESIESSGMSPERMRYWLEED